MAHGEQDRTPGFRERVAHLGVVALRRGLRSPARLRYAAGCTGRVACVVFPVVDAPGRNRLRVLLLVALGSGPSCTCHGTCVAIETEFEALGVDGVDGSFDSLRPFSRVGDEVAGAVALLGGPAVVDVEVGVSCVFETEGDEAVGDVESRRGSGVGAAAVVLE